ncbi:MAG: glucoamylase family protein [Burkholderiales bacterium]
MLEAPIRSLLFGQARFEQHARSLAETHEVVPGRTRGSPFFPRVEDNLHTLRQARGVLERHAREGLHLGPAANWLLDNAALLDEQLHTIRRDLPRSFFRKLPRLRDEPLRGLPRIYGVAWAWVAHTDSGLDTPLLEAYLRAYQQQRELTLAELWALPTTLRVVLLENLRRLAERTAVLQAARDAAHQWIDQPDALHTVGTLDALDQALAARGVAEAFTLQLQQREDELPAAQGRELSAWLSLRLPDPAGALARQQALATEDHQSIRNAITTLRLLDRVDWRALYARTCRTMQTLAQSPVFAAERDDTQNETLRAVERLALKSRQPESAVAERLLALARSHPDPQEPGAAPAYWWRGPGQDRLRQGLGLPPARWPVAGSPALRRWATASYLSMLALLAGGATAWLLHQRATADTPAWLLALCGLLLLGPVSEAVVAVVNRLISESAQPAHLPRLALDAGIPEAHRVLVVMPTLLTSEAGVAALCAQLEQHHIANPEAHAQFALLSDWADADAQHQPGDAALLQAAQAGLAALNQRHPPSTPGAAPRFLLLHRARQWSDSEQRWIGWERKRGKLEQLIRLLAEPGPHAFFLPFGALSEPAPGTAYIVTLDADTDMPPGRLRDLVGVAAHPLNLPRIDVGTRHIQAGYGILQPRVITPLPAPDKVTPFHWLFTGRCGIDPYAAASSELYQDVFGEGTFTGKGLLNVPALHTLLSGRLPEGQVLSHDLLEGAIARCAGVSDVTLVEDAPVHADVAGSRLHRWTRGDWQLLPFLARPGRFGTPLINRWKMLDNLRRSLVAPLSLALLLLVLASGVLPLGWALISVAAAFCAGPLLGAVAGLAPERDDIALGLFYRHAVADLGRALTLAVWHIAQLLQLALLYGDAIGRALYRQAVSRRHLLQWTTTAAAQAGARHELRALLRGHARVPIAAALLGAALLAAWRLGAPVAWPAALPLLLLWAASPVWTWYASRPRPRPRPERLDEASREWLQGVARDTWRFYEQHVGAADHHLPPDNVQHTPHVMVAHRTSPTNMGLYLLAAACARELGFIGSVELADRLARTLDTLERLPRHAGHFYNWYDTQTLAVLPPAYVSTVDSGNFSGLLLAVARACEVAVPPGHFEAAARRALAVSTHRLHALLPVLEGAMAMRTLAHLAHGPITWPADAAGVLQLHAQVREAQTELAMLRLGQGDAADDGSMWLLHDHIAQLDAALRDLQAEPLALDQRLHALAARCRALALAPDYALLYDRERRLLHIGYRVETQQLDDGHYDLLASEARLTSLLAIAKGDVPVAHWAALGRPFFACGREVGLKSWSGSMFEYLMPSLILDEPIGSVLHQATRTAVTAQRQEAVAAGTPWGISESAIAGQDHTLAYQYGPQGVAHLALRRTPADERVIAPYATALAALVAPVEAVANLHALQKLGARRALGFIEAIDYTPQRQVAGSHSVPVLTFMAHHQAMSLAALTDVLCDGAPRRWAMSDPLLRAVGSLLQERVPREVPVLADLPVLPAPRRTRSARLVVDAEPLAEVLPATQLLTNGHYAVVLRSHGGGYSQWQGIGLTRWRDDLLRDEQGTLFYLRRAGTEDWHSLTTHPAADPAAHYTSRLQADRVLFDASWPDLHSRCTVWVSPEDGCELRQIDLTNSGPLPLTLQLAGCAEATLSPLRADEAHPAFANLFIQARWDAADQALYLRRQPRLGDEEPLRAVHFLAQTEGDVETVSPCADRGRWLGRYGSAAQPLGDGGATFVADAILDAAVPGQALDTGLDPLAGILVKLRLASGASVRLTFCTGASRDAEVLTALVDKYRQPTHAARSSSMSHTMAGIRLRELQFDTDTWAAMLRANTLLTSLVTRELPPPSSAGTPLRCDRRLLWRHGISGDRPIVLVHISGEQGLELMLVLRKALQLWSAAGLGTDLVVLNAEPASYLSPVQHQLQQLRERLLAQQDEHTPVACRGTLHLLMDSGVSADERHTLQTLARLRLAADGRSLAQQIDRLMEDLTRDHLARQATKALPVMPLLGHRDGSPAAEAPPFTFDADNGDVHFTVSPRQHPARPWVNVLANPVFGCQVSEAGSGFTWAGNSRMHQVSGWSNDALTDPPSEWLLLHDLETRRVWPLGRALQGGGTRDVVHGLGHTRMQQRLDGLDITLSWCVDAELALKQVQVTVHQAAGRPRRLRLVALVEWTLGGSRAERLSLATRARPWRPAAGAGLPEPARMMALEATQLDHLGGHGGATAFLALRPPRQGEAIGTTPVQLGLDDWTCDRREFFDSAGRLVLPGRLGSTEGAGLDACAALGCELALSAGQESTVTLLLGHAAQPQAAQALLQEAWAVDPAERLARQRGAWRSLLGTLKVKTPDAQFDALVNHWLPYQTLACRLWARAGFYQAGGAYGFRDQLQDAMSLVNRVPELLAAQIRTNAARQFPEGDVQHWWHAPEGAGVRTHCSDDLLWLPYACALYVQRTGDVALLDEEAPFLAGSSVPPGAEDVYETPQVSDQRATLYEHAARAIDRSLASGPHGLPLMGSGDWNDGMNRVGHEGHGESVWLAWFLCTVVDGMLPLAAARLDAARQAQWQTARRGWQQALMDAGWDGQWYRRGYFDDGTPLGAAANAECRIDLIAQAWAVLSGAGDAGRAQQAMDSAAAHLVDPQARLMRLLDPPLQHAEPSAGYIQAYPPGVRENGGQYNHAGVWALMAWARLGDADAVWRAFTALSPAHRWADPVLGPAYAIEPYVMAGDIYTHPPYVGRGGWSWYTGSAGWLARAAVESICGVVLAEDKLTVTPCLPPHWREASVTVQYGGNEHCVVICANEGVVRQVQTRDPRARRAQPGEPISLAGRPDGSVHVLCMPATAQPPATAAGPALVRAATSR